MIAYPHWVLVYDQDGVNTSARLCWCVESGWDHLEVGEPRV